MIWEARFALPAALLSAFVLPFLAGLFLLKLLPRPGLRSLERAALAYPVGLGLVYVLLWSGAIALPPEIMGYAAAACLLIVTLVSAAIGTRRSLRRRYAASCRRAVASKSSRSAGSIGGTAELPAFTSTYRCETCSEL